MKITMKYASRRLVDAALFCAGMSLILGGAYHGIRHSGALYHDNTETRSTANNENDFDALGAGMIISGMVGVAASLSKNYKM